METAAQRRKRWRRLRNHLRAQGLQDVPDDCLVEPKPEWPTRPGVPLVAYFPRVKQKAVGRAAVLPTISPTVAILALVLAIMASAESMVADQLPDIAALVLNIVVFAGVTLLVGFAVWFTITWPTARAPFHLNLEELSLELPTGTRHVPWGEVYSAAPDAEEQNRLRVRLQDGMDVLVDLDEPDLEPLADLMVELILRHR